MFSSTLRMIIRKILNGNFFLNIFTLLQTLALSYFFSSLIHAKLAYKISTIFFLFILSLNILCLKNFLISFRVFLIAFFVSNISFSIIQIFKYVSEFFYFKDYFLNIHFLLILLIFNSLIYSYYLSFLYYENSNKLYLTSSSGLIIYLLSVIGKALAQVKILVLQVSFLNILFSITCIIISKIIFFLDILIRIRIVYFSFFEVLGYLMFIAIINTCFYIIFQTISSLVVYNISCIKVKNFIKEFSIMKEQHEAFNNKNKLSTIYKNSLSTEQRESFNKDNLSTIYKNYSTYTNSFILSNSKYNESDNLYINDFKNHKDKSFNLDKHNNNQLADNNYENYKTINRMRLIFHQFIAEYSKSPGLLKYNNFIVKDLNYYFKIEINNILKILNLFKNSKITYKNLPGTADNLDLGIKEKILEFNIVNYIVRFIRYNFLLFKIKLEYDVSYLNIVKILDFLIKTRLENKIILDFEHLTKEISYIEKIISIDLGSINIEDLILKYHQVLNKSI